MACIMVLFLFTFLEFCVSISTAAFGCKTVCRDSYSQVVTMHHHGACINGRDGGGEGGLVG